MLYSVTVKNTERKSRFGINFLGILQHVSLLLDSFELSEQKFTCIDKVGVVTFFKDYFVLFLSEMMINGVIDREPFDGVDVLDELETHGTSYSSVPEIRKEVHEEFVEARTTESVTAMNEDSGDVVLSIVVFFTELTGVFVDEFSNEFFYFRVLFGSYVFSLPEEEGGWVFELFHTM